MQGTEDYTLPALTRRERVLTWAFLLTVAGAVALRLVAKL